MNQLPSLAEKIAAPLKNTGKMIFVSGDGSGPSKLTTDIGNIMAGLPDTVETMTGMNIKNVLKRLEGKQGGVESSDSNAFAVIASYTVCALHGTM